MSFVAICVVAAILALAATQYLSVLALRDIALELRHFKVRVLMPEPVPVPTTKILDMDIEGWIEENITFKEDTE